MSGVIVVDRLMNSCGVSYGRHEMRRYALNYEIPRFARNCKCSVIRWRNMGLTIGLEVTFPP